MNVKKFFVSILAVIFMFFNFWGSINANPTKNTVVFTGQSASGKTSIIERRKNNHFNQDCRPTQGNVRISVGSIDIWEITQTGSAFLKDYIGEAKVVCIVIDATKPFYTGINTFRKEFSEMCPDAKFIVAVNKWDALSSKERKIVIKLVIKFADNIGADFVCVSAKTGASVNDLFYKIERICKVNTLNAIKNS